MKTHFVKNLKFITVSTVILFCFIYICGYAAIINRLINSVSVKVFEKLRQADTSNDTKWYDGLTQEKIRRVSNAESTGTYDERAAELNGTNTPIGNVPNSSLTQNNIEPFVTNERCTFIPLGPLIVSEKHSDEINWSYQQMIQCPEVCLDIPQKKRLRLDLDCTEGQERLVVTQTMNVSDVFHISYGNHCLHRIISNCCDDGKPIPNVFHYVLYGYKALNIYTLMSLISAVRFQKPCLILIHGPNLPFGRYWEYFLHIYSNVIHVVRDMPTTMGGQELGFKEHGADIARVEAIKDYGGIYFDYDEVVVRSLDPLRNKPCVMGKATEANLSCGVILAQRNATFMQKWYEGYLTDYRPKDWGFNCLFYPTSLARKFPDLIHISGFNFTTPNWQNLPLLFKQNFNWSQSYAIHLYIRFYNKETTVESIRSLNTTIGALGRHIIFGNKELCTELKFNHGQLKDPKICKSFEATIGGKFAPLLVMDIDVKVMTNTESVMPEETSKTEKTQQGQWSTEK